MRENWRKASLPVIVVLMVPVAGLVGIPQSTQAADYGPFDDVERGFFSLGGRATHFDPKEGDANWYGGLQARLYLGRVFAIEASADYRRNHFGDSRVDTYPVQASVLAYLLPGKRLSPFVLGGAGWYYTHVKGPGGFDDTQNRFGLHAGGGLSYVLNRTWSIDSTYRYIWLEKIASKEQNIADKEFKDAGHMVTIGLNYHF